MIKGNLTVQNNGSPIEIGANNANACAGNTVGNNLQADNNYAALSIDYNNVGGNLQVNNDTAATDVSGNTVTNNLQCQDNTPAVTHVAPNMRAGAGARPMRRLSVETGEPNSQRNPGRGGNRERNQWASCLRVPAY